MFKSIRWRLILIYFLLVFFAMSVVGIYIVNRLEKIQLNMNTKNMTARIKTIIETSNPIKSGNWMDNSDKIQQNINSFQVGYNEYVYVVLNDEKKTIIASSVQDTIGQSAFNTNQINNYVLTKSFGGNLEHMAPPDQNEYEGAKQNPSFYHMSFPVYSDGEIQGYIYLVNNIEHIYETVDQSKEVMTQSTIIALSLTIILGFILSSGITKPIKELTLKAREMSKGNFEQKVSVKSTDEIGQLGNTFNFLIDELKKSMSNLVQEKSKLETTFKYMADGILTVDIEGNIIHSNPVAQRLLSIKNEDEKYDDAVRNVLDKLLLCNLKEKKYHGTEVLGHGSEMYLIDYAPFMNNKNEVGGVIIVFKNITEQYKIDKLQKEFVANVSHELKTPITTIKSYTETLLEGALEERLLAVDFLNVINSESDRMARLVSDLLKLSRMDYEETKWKKEKLNIKDTMENIGKKLIVQSKNKNVNLHMDLLNDANIMFDRDGFEQIILNIAGNAIKYTPEGGNVWISTFRKNKKVQISIKDDGIGIPKEDRERVFERFYRVDKARSRELGGTGLGLSIAKQIASVHDSTITINGELKIGTEIIITIPELV